jgi:hypothetical protein
MKAQRDGSGLCALLLLGASLVPAVHPASGASPESGSRAPMPVAAASELTRWRARCARTVFTPAPELRAATERAAARWAGATGCDIRVGPAGLPVVLVPNVVATDGEPANGATDGFVDARGRLVAYVQVRIARTAKDPERTLLHEMGHALGALGHAQTGIMAVAPSAVAHLDPAAIELVCATLDCVRVQDDPPPISTLPREPCVRSDVKRANDVGDGRCERPGGRGARDRAPRALPRA